jgi:hypothetical protein
VKRTLSVPIFSTLTFSVFNADFDCKSVTIASNDELVYGPQATPSTVKVAVIDDVLGTAPVVRTDVVAPVWRLSSK